MTRGLLRTKSCRLSTMLGLTVSFFLVEIITGFITNSLALVADSFHMLSDVIALIVGIASVRVSKWHTQKNTFGWARAEVLGAMVNAVFLVAMCFNITLESLERFIEVEEITNPKLVLVVGSIGLAVNLVGLLLFHGHGHSHGGSGHSHGEGRTARSDVTRVTTVYSKEATTGKKSSFSDDDTNGEAGPDLRDAEKEAMVPTGSGSSSAQLNMRGVFLHVLGDALGSVVVIISSLIIWFVDDHWKYYVDPAMSMLMVVIILSTTIPLLRESGMILLQTVPTHIHVVDLKHKLEKVSGVLSVHEFHVWQLAGNRIIASAHITCRHSGEYMRLAKQIKEMFHDEGIHSTTIQPEFLDVEMSLSRDCVLECGPGKPCFPDTCCGPKALKNSRSDMGLRLRTHGTELAGDVVQESLTTSI